MPPVLACLGVLLAGPGRVPATEPLAAARELVVLDPGHGGANLGAPGRNRLFEKQITLQVAERLARLLRAHGYRVLLTRQRDQYLTLRERVRRSNAQPAAAFISLHANASPDHSQRGVETFVLDPQVAEVEARRAARRAGGPVAALLADLHAAHQLQESIRLARAIQDSLVSLRGAVDRGVRQADHDVLAGVQAPAVLVEMGFIDHVVEGPLLEEPAVQDQIAQALLEGIQRFLQEGGPVPAVSGSERAPRRRGLNMARADH